MAAHTHPAQRLLKAVNILCEFMSSSLDAAFDEDLLLLHVHACVDGRGVMPSPDEESADKPSKLRRPSVHGNSLPQTLPNSKVLTKGRYELSSVRSSSTYPQYPE